MKVGIDANLLILLVVGNADQGMIARHKRLSGYTSDDFRALAEIVIQVTDVLATPQVLTETSNLMIFGLADSDKLLVKQSFSVLAGRLKEIWAPSARLVERQEFYWLDLADCAWLSLLDQDTILLTDDEKLAIAARSNGLMTLRLSDIRTL
jgi:hypothetical protein